MKRPNTVVDVFLSYSTRDEGLAAFVRENLVARGLRVMDMTEVTPGTTIGKTIRESMVDSIADVADLISASQQPLKAELAELIRRTHEETGIPTYQLLLGPSVRRGWRLLSFECRNTTADLHVRRSRPACRRFFLEWIHTWKLPGSGPNPINGWGFTDERSEMKRL